MAELAFEYLVGALEAVGTHGTMIANATHYLNMAGKVTPRKSVYRPDEARGTLAEYYRSGVTRQWSEFDATGPADVYQLPFLLEMAVAGAGVIAVPGGGATSRTHTYTPLMTSDARLSATLYWGDPLVQAFQVGYAMLDTLTITADGSGTSGATQSIKGIGRFPVKQAPGALPAMRNAPLIAPASTLLWIDSGAAAIGTTPITARVISAEMIVNTGITRKFLASGPTGGKAFQLHGTAKRHAELKLVFELPDAVQYDQWAAHTSLKVRCRLNGPLIEGALYHYIQMDIYGPFDMLDWGELEGSNRTVALNVLSEYDTTATVDFAMVVENDLATL